MAGDHHTLSTLAEALATQHGMKLFEVGLTESQVQTLHGMPSPVTSAPAPTAQHSLTSSHGSQLAHGGC